MIKITQDFHTHSKYSKLNHGKNTMEELVVAAISKGLDTIAITDHAPEHPFGVWKCKLKKRKTEIEALREKYPQIKILCGLETNLVSDKGKIDINKKQRDDLDICLMGFHRAGGIFRHLFYAIKMCFCKNRTEKNTDAYVRAIENNEINIITHPKQYIDVDCGRLAEAASKKGVLMEINNRHLCYTKEDVDAMLATNCKFVVDSDAHRAKDVGVFDNAIAFIEKYNIPLDRIVNAKEE